MADGVVAECETEWYKIAVIHQRKVLAHLARQIRRY